MYIYKIYLFFFIYRVPIKVLEVDTKVANALLRAVTAAALASKLASRDASISGLQASKADASALSAVDTSSEVDSKISTALLGAWTRPSSARRTPARWPPCSPRWTGWTRRWT